MSALRSTTVLLVLALLPALSNASPCKPQFEGALWAERDLRIVGVDAAYQRKRTGVELF